MKNTFFALVSMLLLTASSHSQTTLFTDAIQPNLPSALSIVGDELYVGTLVSETLFQKIELSNPDSVTTLHDFEGVTGVWKMVYDPLENDMYVYTFDNSTVYRFDLEDTPPIQPDIAFTTQGTMGGMTLYQNKIYFSAFTGTPTNSIIYVYDIAAGTIPEPYFDEPSSELEIRNMAAYDGELYYSELVEPGDIELFKIPIDSPDPQRTLVSDLSVVDQGADQSMLLVGDQLYIGVESVDSVILKMSLTDPLPSAATVMISDYPGGPLGLAFKDGIFYGSEGSNFTIVNFEDPDLSITEQSVEEPVVYPNPVKNRIYLQNKSNQHPSYKLYGVTGSVLSKGIYKSGGIDTTKLPAGIYLLQVELEQGVFVKKIVKE